MSKYYNVWGREFRTEAEANASGQKALADNPKIKNLHVACIVYEPTPVDCRRHVRYQARWYNHKVACKLAMKKRSQKLQAEANRCQECGRSCDCEA